MSVSAPLPLLYPVSHTTTEANRTGSWRFARPVFREKTAPCSAACPAGIDIARVEMLAGRGLVHEAWQTICLENPLPAVCGRVCFHPCERACNRGEWDAPIAINALERYIGDAALAAGSAFAPAAPATGRRVAIVGSGPAGLSAAYFLARLGIEAEIFEAASEPGGVLRWGIPGYRLPKDVLEREIRRILDLGVTLHTSRKVNEGFLSEEGNRFQALLVGVGLAAAVRLHIPGEDLVLDGLDFLRRVQEENVQPPAGEVAVIGGGNTAVDVARTLLRMGASPTIVYRRRREDMPAFSHEMDAAEAEGVRLMTLFAPVSLHAEPDGLRLMVQGMRPAEKGADGRFRAVPTEAAPAAYRFSAVFSGIGAAVGDPWHRPPDGGALLRLDHCTVATGKKPIAWIGDPVTAVNSVADAIASGKEAAMALHEIWESGVAGLEAVMGRCRVGTGPAVSMEIHQGGGRQARDRKVVAFSDVNTDYFPKQTRKVPRQLAPSAAARTFGEVVAALSPADALWEAGRCFNCGVCNDCDNCRIFCPDQTVVRLKQGRRIDLDYCKGCGVCTVECPRGVLHMEEESV